MSAATLNRLVALATDMEPLTHLIEVAELMAQELTELSDHIDDGDAITLTSEATRSLLEDWETAWREYHAAMESPQPPLTEADRHAVADAMTADIAYQACRSDIESNCFSVREFCTDRQLWWNTSVNDSEMAYWVDRAVVYLELRGYIERRPDRPAVVRILDFRVPGTTCQEVSA